MVGPLLLLNNKSELKMGVPTDNEPPFIRSVPSNSSSVVLLLTPIPSHRPGLSHADLGAINVNLLLTN